VPLVPDKKIARTVDRSRKRHGSYPEFRGIEMRREVEVERRWKIIENTAAACHCLTAEPRFVRWPPTEGSRTVTAFRSDRDRARKYREPPPYRKIEIRISRKEVPGLPAALQAVSGSAKGKRKDTEAAFPWR
jgi:hypothetical protein